MAATNFKLTAILSSLFLLTILVSIQRGEGRPSPLDNHKQSGALSMDERALKPLMDVVAKEMYYRYLSQLSALTQQTETSTCDESELSKEIDVFQHASGEYCVVFLNGSPLRKCSDITTTTTTTTDGECCTFKGVRVCTLQEMEPTNSMMGVMTMMDMNEKTSFCLEGITNRCALSDFGMP